MLHTVAVRSLAFALAEFALSGRYLVIATTWTVLVRAIAGGRRMRVAVRRWLVTATGTMVFFACALPAVRRRCDAWL